MPEVNRTPAGVPTGGQFAPSTRGEATVALASRNHDPAVALAIRLAKATGTPALIPGLPGTGYTDDGSSCGDISLGAEPSNRATWATGRDDEPFVTVTSTYYVVGRRDSDDHDLDYDDWTEHLRAIERERDRVDGDPATLETVRYAVENRVEWIAHTEVDDPGGTEIRSEYAYESGSALNYLSLHTAETVAGNQARQEDWTRYFPENWT